MFPHPKRSVRHVPRLLFGFMAVLICAGCSSCGGSTGHTTPPTPTIPITPTATNTVGYVAPEPCTSPPPDECRLWVRGALVAAVSFNTNGPGTGDLAGAVAATLNQRFSLGLRPLTTTTQLQPSIPIGSGAGVFLQDAHQEDAALLNDIDTINNAILAPNANGASSGFLPVNQSTAWIVGVSPDWYGTPAQTGGEHIHGSPDGPPAATAPTTVAVRPGSAGANSNTNVYVVDTGYHDPSGYPAAGASVLFDDLHTVWDERNTVASLTTDAPGTGELVAPYEFDQADPAMAALTPAPTYSPSNYRAVNVADHGIAISALIHWLAPTAHIHQARVLNDYGVGDLQSLLATLQAIYANDSGKAIINLSLNYGPPAACMADYWNAVKASGSTKAAAINEQFATKGCATTGYTIGADSRRYLPLGLAIAALQQDRGDIVVAAAGNASGGGVNVAANMPALYCGVVATGAVTTPGGSTLTTFSNRPDTPCMTFTVVHKTTDTEYRVKLGTPTTALALGQGVCSLHFTKILPYDTAPPANDLALWSGTSFAAALVSGNIAANPAIVPAAGGPVTVANQTVPCKG
jgi:hypothetical protein